MKGVILAGGRGTRLYPLTEMTNKHLLRVGKEPMVWHPVKQLVRAGIQDILVITSAPHMGDIVNSLGSGQKFACDLTYRVQEQPLGIAHALSLAASFVQHDKMAVLLGDNIFEESIAPHVDVFKTQEKGAMVLLKTVEDLSRYGVATLKNGVIANIEEKPARPMSGYAVVGCYLYDAQVFDYLKTVKRSKRGEYEITSVNNWYLKRKCLQHGFISGRWADAGTFESLSAANDILRQRGNAGI